MARKQQCGCSRVLKKLLLVLTIAIPAARAVHSQENSAAVRDFNTTAALQNSGFYSRAEANWRKFLQQYPNDDRRDRATYYLGICQLHTQQFDDAVRTFRGTLTSYPEFSSQDAVRFNLAMAQYQIATKADTPESYRAAASAFADVPKNHATSKYVARAMYFQGESLYAAGDLKDAATVYRQLIGKAPDDAIIADTYYALGTLYQEWNDHDSAIKTFLAFLARPNATRHDLAAEIRLRTGISQFELKKFAEAEKIFVSIANDPKQPLADFALLRQGQCLLEIGRYGDAVKLFEDLPKRFPDSQYKSAAQLAAGKCLFNLARLPDAERALTPLSSDNKPESAEAAYWLGRTLLSAEQPEKALAVLQPAIAALADSEFAPYLRLTRIDALYDIEARRKEATPLYVDFAAKNPNHPLAAHATYMAALSALNVADYESARKQAEAFLTRNQWSDNPLLPAVLYVAGEANLLPEPGQERSLVKAEQYYRQLVEKHPRHQKASRSLLRIGLCLAEAGKHDECVAFLNMALSKMSAADELAEANLLIGRSHAAENRDREAINAFDAATKAKPDWQRGDELLLATAASHLRLNEDERAADKLRSLISRFASSDLRDQATFQLARITQEQQKYDEAIKLFQSIPSQFADSPYRRRALYGIAACYYAQSKFQQAIEPLDDLLSATGDQRLEASANYLRGLAYHRLKKFESAIKDLQSYMATQPSSPERSDARFVLALCQIGAEQLDAAAVTLRAILDDDADYQGADKVLYELAHLRLKQDKPNEAADAFGRLVTQHAVSELAGEAYFWIGRHHETLAAAAEDSQRKDELAKAAVAYRAGLPTADSNELKEKLRYKLGDMQFRQGQFRDAVATLLDQIELFPDGPLATAARFLAAESLFRQDKFAEAIPLFQQVAQAKDDKYSARALYRAGDCAGRLRRWPESQQMYEALIARSPKFDQIHEARYGLAWAIQNQNQLDRALAIYEQITKATESEAAAKSRFMIGEIAFGRKQFEDAVASFLEVAVGYPYKSWQALARFEAARCFIELKKTNQAIESLRIIMERHADHPKAADAETLLGQLKRK